ncbi:hypothetical protein P691DRAFT_667324 [Macrolepiota fuliginosa MF-IS2]|uniref:SUN domain-containing protein n=1 Tax=Macrolepiota fuliginosa MF-IS2 TaxID=1400762 RepID=A0A9P6C5M3_9AGAR|nr:hypothetical protein P691DRAFT_667324 [Macrolepiota fuliginosa MF-IS2]
MSFSGTPLGQGRRLDHNTFLGKQPTGAPKPIPTSYSYGAPTTESRSPPRPARSTEPDDNEDENASALAKFAKIKQREALASRPGGPKIITSPPKPDKWAVKDTSVLLASALHIAAKNDMLPATNPNSAWTSGLTRPNPVVPRSTSVEYEKDTQTTTSRRLAAPPNRLSRPPPSRKPLSKNASVRLVPDSEGEEDASATAAANGRGKSPFEHVVDVAKKVLGPATYYVRQLSHEPEDRSLPMNGNTNHNRDTSYDYAAEEQEFRAAQQAKRASLPVHKRGRMSMDNRAYKPSASDVESDEDSSDNDDKRKKRRKKKKNEPVGGPLTTLPVLSADKKKRRKSRGTKSGVNGQDDEESESDDEPSVELESTQAQQRSSVPRSLPPPPSRLSAQRSAPLQTQDTSLQDSSLDSAEQGLDSIPEVPEDELSDSPRKDDRREEVQSRRMPRSSSRPPRESSTRFSIGGLLGRLVHGVVRGLLMIVKFVIYLVTSIFFVCGRVLGTVYDIVLNRPVLWLRTVNLSPAAALVKYLAIGALAVGVWYALQGTDIRSHLPSISFPRPSSQPIYTAPQAPVADITEFAERLQRLELALSGLSHDTRARADDGVRSYSDLTSRLGMLEDRLIAESKRVGESASKAKDALELGKTVNSVKRDIEVLQAQLVAQERQRQQEEQQHRTEQTSDEEARAKLRAFEQRFDSVESGIKEALDLGKKAVSTAQKSSVTVKAPGGQDLKAMVSDVVDAAILLYSKDTIGKADFASHSSGARVIPSLTSPSYEIQPESLSGQMLGFLTGSGYAVGRPPVTALHHEVHAGYCWPFRGQSGQMGVSLAAPVVIEEVTIDHVAKENAMDLRSAPRVMEVWGLIEGEENKSKYLEIMEERQKKAGGAEVVDEEYPVSLPRDPPYMRLANFTYDIDAVKNVQTFPVEREIKERGIDFGVVVLRVLDNWGMEEFTCLYRFRVHGTMISQMRIPEPVEDTGL